MNYYIVNKKLKMKKKKETINKSYFNKIKAKWFFVFYFVHKLNVNFIGIISSII